MTFECITEGFDFFSYRQLGWEPRNVSHLDSCWCSGWRSPAGRQLVCTGADRASTSRGLRDDRTWACGEVARPGGWASGSVSRQAEASPREVEKERGRIIERRKALRAQMPDPRPAVGTARQTMPSAGNSVHSFCPPITTEDVFLGRDNNAVGGDIGGSLSVVTSTKMTR